MDKFSAADMQGQAKVVQQLPKIFSGQTLTIEQHYLDKDTVDIYVTATTKSQNSYLYVFEAKDRDYYHNSFDDIILEIPKYESLMKRMGKYKSMYVHTFKDDWITIWDISKLSNLKKKYMYLPKTTVEDRGKEWRWVYMLPIKQSVYDSSFIVS